MNFEELNTFPLNKIKVRGLVLCGDEYIFIQRQKLGKKQKYLVFPGGRVKKTDRDPNNKKDLQTTLHNALVRELVEELSASDIEIGEHLATNKISSDIEVLFNVRIGSYDWDKRSGHEFFDPSKGSYELISITELSKNNLGKKGYRLKPKRWRKLLYSMKI